MHYLTCLCKLIYLSIISTGLAAELQQPLNYDSTSTNSASSHRIAIIGAGAAGSSAAYHLALFANESGTASPLNITIFDINSQVGGRTTTINALDDPRYPTEVGASIFVKINHILFNATRDFGLSTKDRVSQSTGSVYDLGIWDGTNFVFTVANDDDDEDSGFKGRWRGLWDIAKLLWKYGLSPIRMQRITKSTIGQFLRLYDDYFPFQSLDEALVQTGLDETTGFTGKEVLRGAGVSEQFSREIIQASTRVNYAQNLGNIHALEALVCMAIEGAMAVEGGNWQIFDEAVKRSGATIHLNTAVTNVDATDKGSYQIQTNDSSVSYVGKAFDTVILAAPYQFANIRYTPPLIDPPEKIDYVSLHVTLFTSPYRPSPAYFGLESQDQVPDSILTTLPPDTDPGDTARGEDAVGPTKFWSISTLRVLDPQTDAYPDNLSAEDLVAAAKTKSNDLGRQYLYKIFSPSPITAEFISDLFAFNLSSSSSSTPTSTPISSLPSDQISWSYTKLWSSYPYLPPRRHFDSFRLHQEILPLKQQQNIDQDDDKNHSHGHGLWYTSSMESFISTMETSALSGMNIARLIVDGLEGRDLDAEKKEGETEAEV